MDSKPPNIPSQLDPDDQLRDDVKVEQTDAPQSPQAAASSIGPNTRNDRLFAWLGVIIILFVAMLAIFPDLMKPDPVFESEAVQVVTAVETRDRLFRVIGEDSWLEPISLHRFGREVHTDPPGMVWGQLPMLALNGSTAEVETDTNPSQDLQATRVTQVIFALVLLASVFWAGYGIAGIKTGLFAAMIALATPALLLTARVAVTALPAAAWLALCLAAALWALRPLRPGPAIVRQILGWLLSGAALAALFATAGWFGFLMAIGPMLGIVILCPRRFGHLMAMLSSLCVAALLMSPWLWHVTGEPWENGSGMGGHWLLELWPGGWVGWDHAWRLPWLRLFWVSLIALPWTIWLVGALMQPFSSSSRPVRTRMLIGWLWFVISVGIVFLFGPSQGHAMMTLLILPGLAVMLGQVFRQYSDLSAEGRHANLWQGLKWPFVVLLAVLSILLPLTVYLQGWMIQEQWITQPFAAEVKGWWVIGVATVLAVVCGLAIRYAVVHRPGRTVALSALWSVMAVTLIMLPIQRGPLGVSPMRGDAQFILKHINGSDLYYWSESLRDEESRDQAMHVPEAKLIAMLGRTVLPLHLEEIEAMASDQTMEAKHRVTYVLIHESQGFPQDIEELGTVVMMSQSDWRLCALELGKPNGVEPPAEEEKQADEPNR